MTNSDLRQRAESLLRLMEQRDEITADIKAAFDAAGSVGFNKAAMRKAVAIARMDTEKRAKHDQGQMDLELYLAEIEGKSAIDRATTTTEATVAYLQESNRIRGRKGLTT